MRHQLDGTSWVNREVHAQICGGRRGKFPPPTRHLDDGVDFLSFTIRRFGAKLIIKPSAEAIARFRARTRTAVRSCYGANAAAVLKALAPVNRGWAAYQRTVVSSAVYAAMDNYEWKLLWKWATRSHPNKPKRWVAGRYFGAFNTARADRWVFGDRTTGAYLPKLAWTKIERHVMVKGRASPDDPALDQYWARRHSKQLPPLNAVRLRLLRRQGGRCSICGDFLLHADHPPQSPHEWEQWLETVRTATRKGNIAHGPGVMPDDQHLTHASCSNLLNADPPSWPWILVAFGILAVGTFVSYVVWRSVKPTDFMPSSNYAVYAGLFVMALALERVLEPFSGLFIPSVKAKKAQSTAMVAHAKRAQVVATTSQLHTAVAGPAAAAQRTQEALQAAAAQKDAAVAQKEHHHSQANRAVLMWATAAVLAMLACASLGIFLLRSIETPSAVNGSTASASLHSSSAAPSTQSPAKNPNRLLDLLVTGLVVGAGTKPLHDLISQIQTTSGKSKASASATTIG